MPSSSTELSNSTQQGKLGPGGLFISFVAMAGLSLFIFHIKNYLPLNWSQFLIFVTLSTLFDFMPIQLPRGGMVSVSFIPNYAAILVGGPLLAEVSGLISVFIMGAYLGAPLHKIIFNAGTMLLSLGLASEAYVFLGGTFGLLETGFTSLLAAFICGLVYYIINTISVTTILSLNRRESFSLLWHSNIRWGLFSYVTLMPMGFLMAAIYLHFGPIATTFFSIPLFLSRYSFMQYVSMRKMYLNTMRTLMTLLEAKDPYTRGHSERVCGYALAIGRAMKLSEMSLEILEYSALLHDVGKMGVADNIIFKADTLSDMEFSKVRAHPVIGSNIIAQIDGLRNVANIMRHHHERFDGGGYPDGLVGETIPLESRILAVADAYDAMTTERPYKKALSFEEAMEELKRGAGSQFDPQVVAAFLRIIGGEK